MLQLFVCVVFCGNMDGVAVMVVGVKNGEACIGVKEGANRKFAPHIVFVLFLRTLPSGLLILTLCIQVHVVDNCALACFQNRSTAANYLHGTCNQPQRHYERIGGFLHPRCIIY